MVIFKWDENLVIGIEKIDKQHKELIKKLDDLAQAVLKKQGKDKITKMMRFMEEYGEIHFEDEEKFMRFYNYPGLAEQEKHHERFRKTTQRLKEELNTQKDMETFATSVQRYLIDWLILHIKSEDRKFGEFIEKNKK